MFGRYQSVQWRGDGLDAAPDLGLAAQWQHVVVLLARSAMTVLPMTQEGLAKQMGRERQYVRDRFGGHRWLSLADAAALERLLGVRLIGPVRRSKCPLTGRTSPSTSEALVRDQRRASYFASESQTGASSSSRVTSHARESSSHVRMSPR